MQKQFLSNLIITILLNLLVKPVALFAIDASVQNRVGEAEYGLYFTLLNLTVIFNIFLDFGINNYTTKRIAQQTTNQANFFGSIMVFRLILFILYAIVVSLTAILLGYGAREFHILLFLVINQFGEACRIMISGGNIADNHFETMIHLFKNLKGFIFADKGFISKKALLIYKKSGKTCFTTVTISITLFAISEYKEFALWEPV